MKMDATPTDLIVLASQRWFEELSDCGIFTTDAELVVRTWNPWLEAQTGIAARDAIGRALFQLIPSLNDRGLDRFYREALAGEVRVLAERLHKYLIPISRNLQSTGVAEMAQSARIAPLLIEGSVVGTITVVEDVTERVVAERELRNQIALSEQARGVAEEASKLKDEFLATLSHEIRTPLNAVLGWSRILRTQPKLKSRKHALEVIERNATAQLRLVEDLLDMARVISGKLRLEVKALALDDVARAAIEVVEPAAAAKKLTIDTEFAADLPAVNGDADRLQQAIWNVMSNAVKFTGAGGRITVHTAREGDFLQLTVRDSGQGISREFLPYVFDRFRQADASTSRRHGGLGLGLALVRQIIELHGGRVSVESGGLDRGTVLTMRLPAATGVATQVATRRSSAPVTLEGITVLLVDDDEDGRDMLVTALQGLGAHVLGVRDGRVALEMLVDADTKPDVLISDLGMPETDGFDLIRRVRDNAATRYLPAIAVTAYANPTERLRALAAGYQAHLPKPIDPTVVAMTISDLVEGARNASATAS